MNPRQVARRVWFRARRGAARILRLEGGAGASWIDLRSVLIGDEGVYRGRAWNEIADDAPATCTSLVDSPHLRFLEAYGREGETLLAPGNLERTDYFRLANEWAEMDGILRPDLKATAARAQAAAFVTLYERLRRGDPTEVRHFQESRGHSRFGALPVVRQTLTPGIFQIVDGHHRLAIAWLLGQQRVRAMVLPPMPTELQRLVLGVEGNNGRRELRQPIDRPEFDRSWKVEQPCADRLTWMLGVLGGRLSATPRPSVLDLGCAYGWLVARLSARGFDALGVEPDPCALKIGRIAYGLSTAQLAQSAPAEFVSGFDRSFDVVVVSGGLRALAERSGAPGLEGFLKSVDSITVRCLFFDTTQLEAPWWRRALPEWNREALTRFMRERTSFTEPVARGVGVEDGLERGAVLAWVRAGADGGVG